MTKSNYVEALDRVGALPALAAFDPHVAGTPPLGLDLPTSDIDILCHAPDAHMFTETVWATFGQRTGFSIKQRLCVDRPVIASVVAYNWDFGLFGQAEPVPEQRGWRHFLVERRLLSLSGVGFRTAVMAERRAGAKTEPAFAAVLRLRGDPYQAMLNIES